MTAPALADYFNSEPAKVCFLNYAVYLTYDDEGQSMGPCDEFAWDGWEPELTIWRDHDDPNNPLGKAFTEVNDTRTWGSLKSLYR